MGGSLERVDENVLVDFLLDFDEQVQQTHVRDVGECVITDLLFVFMHAHDVAPVLVLDREKTYVRFDGPSYSRLFYLFGSVAECETVRVCDLVQTVTPKLTRLDR